MARRPRSPAIAGFVIAGAALLAAAPGAALAAPCGDDGRDVLLVDGGGYRFDFAEATNPLFDRTDTFATLGDGGANSPGMTPPGPRRNGDSYDEWGALFVGGTGDEDAYYTADDQVPERLDRGHVGVAGQAVGLDQDRHLPAPAVAVGDPADVEDAVHRLVRDLGRELVLGQVQRLEADGAQLRPARAVA